MGYRFWINFAIVVFWASMIFWISETAYFGWNATPQSDAEKWCDKLVSVGVISGLLIRIEVVCHYVIENHIKNQSK